MYLICYDISSNRRREKISKELKNYGQRIQYSVFRCDISRQRLLELYKKLLRLTDGMEEGSIVFYKVCAKCEEEKIQIGYLLNESVLRDDEIIIL